MPLTKRNKRPVSVSDFAELGFEQHGQDWKGLDQVKVPPIRETASSEHNRPIQ